jgi:hypothetical protein
MARRIPLAAALAALAALVPATSAFAHAGNPNYESVVRGVTPPIPGFSVEVLSGDDRLAVANRGSSTVTIDGYNREPYLRLAPDGTVAINMRSPAYYLNKDRFSGGTVPASADPKAAPSWRVVEHSGRYEFHDHRMHWMAQNVPAQVKDRSVRTKVFDWRVPVQAGAKTGAITGQLFWRGSSGGPPAGAFAALAALVLLGAGSVVVVRRRRAAAGTAGGTGTAGGAAREEAW